MLQSNRNRRDGTIGCIRPSPSASCRTGPVRQGLVARDQARRLPGEELAHTVFVIEFYDGCKCFGYTKDDVTYRAASLVVHMGGWGPNPFVEEHARCVPYVVRCIRSGMDQSQARELRTLLVSLAPANNLVGSKTTVETADCWKTRLPGTSFQGQFRYKLP